MRASRGIRNNNPLNIRYNARNQWAGMTGRDNAGFCTFKHEIYGYRAAWVILKHFWHVFSKKGMAFSLRNIITHWAPPQENDTEAYIQHVAHQTGVPADRHLLLYGDHDTLAGIIAAMARHECGAGAHINLLNIEKGWSLA